MGHLRNRGDDSECSHPQGEDCARLILHAIETGDFYSSKSPEGFPWGKRFEKDVWDIAAENLPSKEMELEYHHEVRRKVKSWLSKMSEYDLMTSEEKFPWTDRPALEEYCTFSPIIGSISERLTLSCGDVVCRGLHGVR